MLGNSHPAKSTLAGPQRSSPRIWKWLISRHSSTCLGWIKWRKNAICIIGIKVNFSEKQTVDEWLLFGSLKPRFAQSSNRRCFLNQLPNAGPQRILNRTLAGPSGTFAEQNQCVANKLASADCGTGKQRRHLPAKNEKSSQFSLMYTYNSLFQMLTSQRFAVTTNTLLHAWLPISTPPPPPPLCITECKLSH